MGAPHGRALQPELQVARTLAGTVIVFALDRSGGNRCGNLWSIEQNSQKGAWDSWSALPVLRAGCLRSGFVDMQNSDGRFELLAAGLDGKIYSIAEGVDSKWREPWAALSELNEPNPRRTRKTGGPREGYG